MNKARECRSADVVVDAFRGALADGERAFLWGVPGGGVLAAVGEGQAPLRLGAIGFRGQGPFWRPARLLTHGDAFGAGLDAPAGPPASDPAPVAAADFPPKPTGHWVDAVRRATEAMRSGPLRKVVLARRSLRRAPAGERFDATETWLALRAENPAAFTFAVTDGGGVFVGATPERLATLAGGVLHTEALAGTAARSRAPETLLGSAKDREEHALVVEEIVAGLAPFAVPGTLSRPEAPGVKALPRVWHLHTPITARARPGTTLLDVVRALHPTPAVCGVPRGLAEQFLSENEGFDRGLYAGPVGWVSDAGEGTFAVGLRSAVLAGETATLYAGAGLVAASEAEAEWRETALKMRTVEDTLRTVRDEATREFTAC